MLLNHDIKITNIDDLVNCIEDMGFGASLLKTVPADIDTERRTIETIKVEIQGMTCSSCVSSIESFVKNQTGIESITVNLITKTAKIVFSPYHIGTRDIIEMIQDLGFEASFVIEGIKSSKDVELNQYFRDTMITLAFAVPAFFMMISMLFLQGTFIYEIFMKELIPGLSYDDVIIWILSTPVQFVIGFRFYKGAWKSLYLLRSANVSFINQDGHSDRIGDECFIHLFSVLRQLECNQTATCGNPIF